MTELRFDGRVAVITGAGRGLGRAYALLLAAKGCKVVVNDPGSSMKGGDADIGVAEEVVQEIKAAGGEAVACTASVATPEGGKAIIQAAIDTYGKIDILIHNAGNVRGAPLKEMTQEDFDSVLDVHLRGAFHVVQPAFALMCEARYGRIVLTSSIGGLYGSRNQANYAVSKAGSFGLSHVAAIEGEEFGVKSNAIVPAAVTRMAEGIDTSIYPPMEPDLVAPSVAWLAHESCSITGELLVSIAGRVAKAYVAETKGVYQPSWTIDQVAERMNEIGDRTDPVIFEPVPGGHGQHIGYSFGMTQSGD